MNAREIIDRIVRMSEDSTVLWYYHYGMKRVNEDNDHGGSNPGIMIAFRISAGVAAQLPIDHPNAEPTENMHITLAYLGRLDNVGENAVSRAIQACSEVAAVTPEMSGRLNGVGRFMASKTSDGKDVIYTSVDVPGLAEFRTDLVRALEQNHVDVKSDHGYVPHITLAYIDTQDVPHVARMGQELKLDTLEVIIGDETRASFQLRGAPVNPYDQSSEAGASEWNRLRV